MYVSDGFYPDGRTRPWREVTIVKVCGTIAEFRYCDTGERGLVPTYAMQETLDAEGSSGTLFLETRGRDEADA